MPSSIDCPEINDTVLLDKIIEERNEPNKSFFEKFSNTWKVRYEEYMLYSGNPENISLSAAETISKKIKFINLYTYPTGTLKSKIIETIEDHGLSYCPFCSGLVVPDTLDHFLPKDIYPEYSIFSKNLIPCCDSCNRAKSTKILHNGERIFFHPYYDDLKNIEVYLLKILPPYDNAPNFELEVNSKMEHNLQKIAIKHLKELKIEHRFRKYFKGQYKRLKKDVVKNKQNGNIDLTALLEIFFAKSLNVDMNYWDTIFYKSVLENSVLLEYLKAIPIEEYEQ